MKELIIVGGGASGLMTSIVAARRGVDVTVLEHKDVVGKKILATGNGRCNYTNSYMDISCFRSDNIEFVEKVLNKFSYEETIDFFMDLGIYPKQIKGYIYPNSLQASSIRDVLELEALHLGVKINSNIKVDHINRLNNHFIINTNQGDFKSRKLVLASGGLASSSLGSDGSGLDLARMLGHNLINPLPGLVQLKSRDNFFKILAGVRTDAYIEVYINDKLKTSERGELQFTKYGVSGIPILQVSRFASKALDESKKVILKIDLLPEFDWKASMDLLESRISLNSYKSMEELFYGLLNNKLTLSILHRLNISKDMDCSKLDKAGLIRLTNMIKIFDVKINETNTFDQAQVTVGGVDTRQVSSDTMGSKIVEDLYFTGEILDVDGTCGGYNLQWAWSSGYIAGSSL